MSQQSVVLSFNDCINARDLDGLVRMMTEDHRFIDTAGAVVSGKPACTEAWRGFFAAFPDYRNIFEHLHDKGDAVIVEGRSECSDPRLNGPGLWRAVVNGSSIAEWRIFEDTPATRHTLHLTAS